MLLHLVLAPWSMNGLNLQNVTFILQVEHNSDFFWGKYEKLNESLVFTMIATYVQN